MKYEANTPSICGRSALPPLLHSCFKAITSKQSSDHFLEENLLLLLLLQEAALCRTVCTQKLVLMLILILNFDHIHNH
jgi:hypothetical protein